MKTAAVTKEAGRVSGWARRPSTTRKGSGGQRRQRPEVNTPKITLRSKTPSCVAFSMGICPFVRACVPTLVVATTFWVVVSATTN